MAWAPDSLRVFGPGVLYFSSARIHSFRRMLPLRAGRRFWRGNFARGFGPCASFLFFFLCFSQSLEVVHPALGMTRGDPFTVAFQVISRMNPIIILNVLGSAYCSGNPSCGMYVNMMLAAWMITEVIRYSCYLSNLLGAKIHILTWLRYTLFIVLYPIGVSGELGVFNEMIKVIQITPLEEIDQSYGGVTQYLFDRVLHPMFIKIGFQGLIFVYDYYHESSHIFQSPLHFPLKNE